MFDRSFWIADWWVLLPVLLLLGGCLPHSCSRTGSQALAPMDSLSREVARSVPVDTLQRVWHTETTSSGQPSFPRTATFLSARGTEPERAGRESATAGDALLAVSDAERGAVLFFSREGQRTRTVTPETFAAPYLIGQRGDTLLVLSPRARRVDFLSDGRVARSVRLALPAVEEAPLLWATALEGALFAKTIDPDGQAQVTRHDAGSGRVVARRMLEGPRWHHAGPLRPWSGRLASLSGFRPVVYRLPPGLSGRADTIRLAGFDSPMLSRTRAYAEGDARQPPLLLPDAAATADGRLFTLNLRAGRLRIDVFGSDGRLRARLAAPGATRGRDVYPRALAVQSAPGGGYWLAVTFTAPRPAVALYHWQPGTVASRKRP